MYLGVLRCTKYSKGTGYKKEKIIIMGKVEQQEAREAERGIESQKDAIAAYERQKGAAERQQDAIGAYAETEGCREAERGYRWKKGGIRRQKGGIKRKKGGTTRQKGGCRKAGGVNRHTWDVERQKGSSERQKDASGAPHAEACMWLETALDQKLLVHAALLHQPASEAAAQRERKE